jgi:hypothetical protein
MACAETFRRVLKEGYKEEQTDRGWANPVFQPGAPLKIQSTGGIPKKIDLKRELYKAGKPGKR